MSKSSYVLGIDLGTSGPKVGLITMKGEVVAHEFESVSFSLLPNEGVEQSPDEWWEAIKTAIHRLLEKHSDLRNKIDVVSCSSQWSGTVALDERGIPLMNAMIWMDARGSKHIKETFGGKINVSGYSPGKLQKWLRLTGGLPTHSGKDSIAHVLYIKNEKPEIYKKTYKFLEPKDYLNFKFTGKFLATFDSITLHWITDNRKISNIRYSEGLIKKAGLLRNKFPDLVRAVDIIGTILPELAREFGIKEDVPVIGGTPDIHSAALGAGAVNNFVGNLYVGTSSWITCHVPYKKTDVNHNMASLPSAIPDRYLLITEQELAGELLHYFRDNIVFPNDELTAEPPKKDIYAAFNRMAADIPAGSDRLIFAPWLHGERSPIDDSTVRGGFFNQTLKTSRSHMIRAIFEGVAFNSKWLLKYVEKFTQQRMGEINIIGGGAKSDLWCQIFADVLDRKVNQVKDPIGANLRGTGFLGAVAIGKLTFEDIPEQVEYSKTFTPNPNHRDIYDELFKEFVNIYRKNRKIFKRLNQEKN